MVKVPVRDSISWFRRTLNRTTLLPVPLLPLVTTIQGALLTACQEHDDPPTVT